MPPVETLRDPLRLPSWQRRAVWTCVAALVATGIAWLALDAWGDASGSPRARVALAWSLRLHGTLAHVFLVVIGSVLVLHVRNAWRIRRNRTSGSLVVATFLALAASGLWLYYGSAATRPYASAGHWLLGLVAPALLFVHRAIGRRGRPPRA